MARNVHMKTLKLYLTVLAAVATVHAGEYYWNRVSADRSVRNFESARDATIEDVKKHLEADPNWRGYPHP